MDLKNNIGREAMKTSDQVEKGTKKKENFAV